MINTQTEPLEKPRYQQPPVLQFLSFTGIAVGFIIVANLIAVAIAVALYGVNPVMDIAQGNLTAPHIINCLWLIQVVGTTLPIFTAPVFYAYVIARNAPEYIKPSFEFPPVLIVLIFCIMFISSPLVEILSNINEKMVLPHFLSSIQKWMRESEDSTEKLVTAMLQMNTIWAMICDVLVVGLLTAIAEEFMFRGVIQTIFTRLTKNTHAAVWITAILFSAFHMEFFGFLPRLFLGAVFGYFVAWSGSIWTSVWAHFINNGTAVVATYLYQHKKISLNPDDSHVFNNKLYIVSLVIVLFLMYLYRYVTLNKKSIPGY
jgi:uncharacterized protein